MSAPPSKNPHPAHTASTRPHQTASDTTRSDRNRNRNPGSLADAMSADAMSADQMSTAVKNNSSASFAKAIPAAVPAAATEPSGISPEKPRFTLSASQVAASVAAAVTAAVVGSRLGVAGTVIGAGLASVISVVGGAIFGHSILYTRAQVRRAVLQVRGSGVTATAPAAKVSATAALSGAPASRSVPQPPPDLDITTVIPAAARAELMVDARGARPGPERAEPGRPRPTRRRMGTRLVIGFAAAAAVFTSSLGAVTLIEAIKGSPLSGGEAGGLSVLGGNGGNSIEVPSSTDTYQPDPTTVTQTVTSEGVGTQTTEPAPSTISADESSTKESSAEETRPPKTGSSGVGASTSPTTPSGSLSATATSGAPSPATGTGGTP